MAIIIYKYTSHIDWESSGIGVTYPSSGGLTPISVVGLNGTGVAGQVAVFSSNQVLEGFDGFTYEEDSGGIGLLKVANIKAPDILNQYGNGENLTLEAGEGDSIGVGGSLYLSPGSGGGGIGQIFFGSATFTDWVLNVGTEGVQDNIYLTIAAKGNGSIQLGNGGGAISLEGTGIGLNAPNIMTGGIHDTIFYGSVGVLAHQTGYDLTIKGGSGYPVGTNDGGDLYLYGGSQYGGGVVGKIFVGTGSAGTNPLVGSGTGTSILLYNRATGEITFGDK